MGNHNLLDALKLLHGLECKRTHYNECGILILYLDHASAPDRDLTLWRLYIDAAWRLERDKQVVMGYTDSDIDILLHLRRLWTLRIKDVHMDVHSFDLSVEFNDGQVLRVFTNSKTNEQWQLRRSDGLRIGIAAGLVVDEHMAEPDK